MTSRPAPRLGLLLLLVVGCQESGPDFLSQGSGPANALPLEPFRPGTRIWTDEWTRTVGARVLRQGEERLRVVSTRLRNPQLEVSTRGGLWLHESAEDGPYPEPILLVPETVRVGMRWRSGGGGSETLTFEVVSREVRDTLFGPGSVVWQIDQTSATGAVVNRQYVEGVGSLEIGTNPVRGAVIPLEGAGLPREPTPPAALPLRALDEGVTVLENFLPDRVSVVTPAEPGGPVFVLRGRSLGTDAHGFLFEERLDHCVEVEPDRVRLTVPIATTDDPHAGARCPAWSMPGAEPHAERVVILDGQTYWLSAGEAALVRSFGVVSLDTDEQRLDYGITPWLGSDPGGPLRYGWNLLGAGPLFAPTLTWVVPALEPVDAHVALFSDGVLATSRLEGDLLAVPSLEGFVDARTVAHVRPEGRDLLAVTADGLVDEIRLDAGRPERRRLAALDLPAGTFLVGAARLEDRLVAAVQRRADPDDTIQGTRRMGNLHFFAADLPAEPLAEATLPLDPAAAITIRFSGNDLLVCWPPSTEPLVTDGWTLGGVPVHGVVPVTPSCALAVRDLRQSRGYGVDAVTPPHWGAAEAVVPGVGRTLLVAPPPDPEDWALGNGRGGAALPDGGLVTMAHVHAPGGVTLGGIRHALYPTVLCSLLPDLSGAGLWAGCETRVYRLDGDSLAVDLDPAVTLGPPAQGGGVLVSSWAGRRFLSVDGDLRDVAVPAGTTHVGARLADGRTCGSRSAAGRTWFFCSDDDGTIRDEIDLGGPDTELRGIWSADQGAGLGPYFSLGDGSLLGSLIQGWSTPVPVRVVPDASTVEPSLGLYPSAAYMYNYPHGFWNDPEGELWVVFHPGVDPDEDDQVGRVLPEGFVSEPLAAQVRAAVPSPGGPVRIQSAHVFAKHALLRYCFQSAAAECSPTWIRVPRPGTAPPLEDEAEGDPCLPAACSEYGACTAAAACDEAGTRERLCREATWQAGQCVSRLTIETAACTRDTDDLPCDPVCDAFGPCVPDAPCVTPGERTRTCSPGTCAGGTCTATGFPETEREACTVPDPEGQPCGSGDGAECRGGICLETDCGDGINNDLRGSADCADHESCDGEPCNPAEPAAICCWAMCVLPENC